MSTVYYGDAICREKMTSLMTEMGLPDWLMPLQDVQEFRYEKETGYVWLKQRKKKVHKIEEIGGRLISYDTVITAYIEPKKIRKLTGVKAKEFIFWITLDDIHIDTPSTGTITLKTRSGITKSFTALYNNHWRVIDRCFLEQKVHNLYSLISVEGTQLAQ
ncbi:unnamed protein product [Ilex paraguariensis]|uniref:Uncharacterized protein n=1 Tax=Ilex paraguariensis TaxID=185542 RepID=A0ABC8RLL8_9AQUA